MKANIVRKRIITCTLFLALGGAIALPASAQVLASKSFSINSGAGGSGATTTSCMIMSDGTSWSGGAVGVQGTNNINNLGTHYAAANVTFKYNVGATVDSLNATYGAGKWTIANPNLSFQYTLYANNNRFNAGPGTFNIYWVANDSWVQGTVNPAYATNLTALTAWATNASLLGAEYYPWTTPGYTGTTNDLYAGVWVTDKTGIRQSTNFYSLALDPAFVSDIISASAASNPNVSLYLMATDDTMGICIFTGGASYLPTLSFDVVAVPQGVAPSLTTPPQSQAACNNSVVTFVSAGSGTAPLGVQWQASGDGGATFTNLSGATSASYGFTTANGENGEEFRAVYTNAYGAVTSSVATLTLNVPVVGNVNYTRNAGMPLKIRIADLLTNASSGCGSIALAGVGATTNGATLTTNGTFIYVPAASLADGFTYTVSDSAGGTNCGQVFIAVGNSPGQSNATVSLTSSNAVVNFFGVAGDAYVTERSTNLTDWTDIGTNTAPPAGLFQVIDDYSIGLGGVQPDRAYYRLRYNP